MKIKNEILTKKVGLIAAITASIVIISVLTYQYFKNEFEKLMDYCYKLSKFTINSFTSENADFSVSLLIQNKSDIDIKVKSFNLGVYVNDVLVSSIVDTDVTLLKANDVTEISMDVQFNPLQVLQVSLQNFSDILLHRDKIRISTKGYFTGGSGFIVYPNYPIDVEYTLTELTSGSTTDTCWKDSN